MHGREARKAGIDDRRIDVLAGWREASAPYSERERAALALTEAMTLLHHEGVPDNVWAAVETAFGERSRVTLIMAICAINVWNRLAVTVHQSLPEVAA